MEEFMENKAAHSPETIIKRHLGEDLQNGIEHDAIITIMASAQEIYEFWRDLKNLPLFMKQLTSVEIKSSTHSLWKWKALRGQLDVEWESEITHDVPGSKISWRAKDGSTVSHAGAVSFFELPYNRGTAVHVHLSYHPPGGAVTDFLERIVGESPQRTMQEDLRRLRQLIEAGEIPTTEGQPRGGMEPTVNPAFYTHH